MRTTKKQSTCWHPTAAQQVVAVVKSAVEGSEDALAQLQKGAGAGSYKSAIKAEVGNRDMSFQPSQIKQI